MYKQITIQTLIKQGRRKTEVAREMGCHRNTVRNIILVGSAREKQTRNKPSYFSPYHDHIKELVDKKVSNLKRGDFQRKSRVVFQQTHFYNFAAPN